MATLMTPTAALVTAVLLVHSAPAQPSATSTVWTQHQAFPTPRGGAEMAFDSRRGRLVVFGGGDQVYGSGPVDELWEGDATGWQQRVTAIRPAKRMFHGFVYHAANQRILLFGGSNLTGDLGDTWEWDGQTWTQRHPLTAPSARSGPAMAYDAARQRTVLYGGVSMLGGGLHDTWEWDGTSWTQMRPAGHPTTWVAQMTYDAARQRAIAVISLFGAGSETWEWDGAVWTKPALANTPAATIPKVVYHAARQRTTLLDLGGGSGTWEYDGAAWTNVVTQANPITGAVWDSAVAYDSVRRAVVLVGGYCCGWGVQSNRVWEFTTLMPATSGSLGQGCAGSAGRLTLAPLRGSLPWIGDTFALELLPVPSPPITAKPVGFLGASSQLWAGAVLPFDLSVLGAPGCTLYTGVEIAVPLVKSTANAAPWQLSIPNNAGLVGTPFYLQGMLLDDPVNPARIATSNAVAVRAGVR